jgi:hypothetical protein
VVRAVEGDALRVSLNISFGLQKVRTSVDDKVTLQTHSHEYLVTAYSVPAKPVRPFKSCPGQPAPRPHPRPARVVV